MYEAAPTAGDDCEGIERLLSVWTIPGPRNLELRLDEAQYHQSNRHGNAQGRSALPWQNSSLI